MPQTEAVAPLELMINRTISAPRERVFRAWTEASELERWFTPDPECVVKSSVDLRVGGTYRIEIHKPDGQVHAAYGVYREIQRPERLVFTWTAGNCSGAVVEDSLVTVEFYEIDGKTQISLTHQQFTNVEVRERHNQGWNKCFENLQKILQ